MAASSPSSPSSRRLPIVLVTVDLICILLAALPTVILAAIDHPYRRGFACSDETIQYPYLGVETVPFSAVVLGGFLLNIVPMIIGEVIWSLKKDSRSESFVKNLVVSSLYKKLGAFLIGAAISQAFTDVAKYSIGRLRPHFLSVCLPAGGGATAPFNCSHWLPAGEGAEPCTGDAHLVNEARKSFYSGHSSFAMYSALYLAFYLQSRARSPYLRTLRPLAQALLLLLALWVSLTRVSDYMHHWGDVVCGLAQGALTATFVALRISDLFKAHRPAAQPLSHHSQRP